MEYREITGFLRRRIVPGAITFIIVLTAAIGFSFIVTPEYESDCMLTISTGGGMGLLGDIGFLKELTTFSKTGTPLDTQIELIKLTPRLQECIDALDLRDDEDEPLKPEDFLDKIRVHTYENTDIIQIKAYDRDPEVARNIAQFLAENHLGIEAENNRQVTATVYRHLEKKVSTIKSDLDDVDTQLADFMEREGAIDVETEVRVQVESLGNLEKEYYILRAELAGVRSRRGELEQQLTEYEPTITSAVTVQQNPEIQSLQQSLNSAEIRLAGYLTRYTENHPDVITVREQIEGYRSRIAELAAKVVSSEITSPNPVYQQLLREYASSLALEEGLVGQLGSVQSVLGDKRESMEGLAEKEIEYLSLVRRQKILTVIYGEMQARLEQVPLYTDGSDTSIAGKIIKPAQLPEKPVKPNKMLNAVAGFVIGLLLAFLIALWLEFTDRLLRGPEEIEKALGLKHMGTLSRQPAPGELETVYGGIIAGLQLTGDADRVVTFLCFGRPMLGLNIMQLLAKHAASAGPHNLVVFDNEYSITGDLITGPGAGGDLVASLTHGVIKSVVHPDGYSLVAGLKPYPVDLLIGEKFTRFLDALKAFGGRSFLFAPVASHAPAAIVVCAACDGTVLLVDTLRTTLDMIKQAVDDIETAGGKIVGFINLT